MVMFCFKKMAKRLSVICFTVLLLIYVSSYLVLSRRGYAEATKYNLRAFHYWEIPTNGNRDKIYRFQRIDHFCKTLFWPINKIDCLLGTGRAPGTMSLIT